MRNITKQSFGEADHETVEAIRNTYRAMDRKITALLAVNDLTRPQFMALKAVSEGGAVPMNKISDCLSVTPGNVTGIIDRLVRGGMLKRSGKEGDRRKIMIGMTKKGEDTYRRVLSAYSEFLGKVLSQLSQTEREELKEHLTKLEEAIESVKI